MIFNGKYRITSEKRHAKVLILKKEQTFLCFFFKNLKYGLCCFISHKTSIVFVCYKKRKNQLQTMNILRSKRNLYSIEAIKAFASNDEETTREILISFIESTVQNVQTFRQHLQNEDFKSLSGQAHKMLPMFRQLHVEEVVKYLVLLEQNSFEKKDKEKWVETGKTILENTGILIKKIMEDHQLSLPDKLIL